VKIERVTIQSRVALHLTAHSKVEDELSFLLGLRSEKIVYEEMQVMLVRVHSELYRVLLLTTLVLLLPASVVLAQTIRQSPTDLSAEKSSPDEQSSSGPLEDEMRAKRAIKFAEDAHKENLERAREVFELGTKLHSSYRYKNSLDRDDNKRLNRLEKLTKQLRSKAGGSDSEKSLENPPTNLSDALKQVAHSSEELSKLVEKTPRQVVSAAVIDEANVLLQLIDLVRQFSR
jgi:hypothetical protein